MKIIMVLPNIIPHGRYVTSGEETPNATAAGRPVSRSGSIWPKAVSMND
jgi:hypothetical protein